MALSFSISLAVLLGTTPADAVVLDFNSTLHGTNGFANIATSPSYIEDGFTLTLSGADALGNWGTSHSNFLIDPVIGSGSSSTYFELVNTASNLFDITSIDVVDFLASQADANVGNQVTFYGTKPNHSVVSSTFSFATTAYDKETHLLPATFTGLTNFTWNQNSAGNPPPIAGAVANRVHFVDNIIVNSVGPPPRFFQLQLSLSATQLPLRGMLVLLTTDDLLVHQLKGPTRLR